MGKITRLIIAALCCAWTAITLIGLDPNSHAAEATDAYDAYAYEGNTADDWNHYDIPEIGDAEKGDSENILPYDYWSDAYYVLSPDADAGAYGATGDIDDTYSAAVDPGTGSQDETYFNDGYVGVDAVEGDPPPCCLQPNLPPESPAGTAAADRLPEKKKSAPGAKLDNDDKTPGPAAAGRQAAADDQKPAAADRKADPPLPREGSMPSTEMRSHPDMLSPDDALTASTPVRDRIWVDHDDQVFLSGMIAHHQAAVEMAKSVLMTSKEPQVREWAEAIMRDQEGEIGLMHSLLVKYGGEDQDAMDRMNRRMNRMMAGMAEDNPDASFVAMMIPHHAAAIEMSLPALAHSLNPQVRQLAEDIILAQTKEIAEFQGWLTEHRKVAKALFEAGG